MLIKNIPATNRAVGGSKKLPGAIFHDQREPEGSPTGKWAIILPGAPYSYIKQSVTGLSSSCFFISIFKCSG